MVKLGGEVATTTIHERVAFRHALVDGRVAREVEADGSAATEITALYMETCKHLDTRIREAA